MPKSLSFFFRTPYANPWTVLFALSLAALAEGIGLATFLPIFSLMLDQGAGDSLAQRIVAELASALGLPMTMGGLLVLVVGAVALKGVLYVLAMRHVGGAVARVSTGLRSRLLTDLMRVRWSYFVAQPLGRIANAVSGEATRAGQCYLLVATLLAHALRAIVLVAVAFTVSWLVALFALVVGGLIAAALNSLVRAAKRAGDRQTRRTAELVIRLSDALNNIKPLKAMNKQASFSGLFARRIESLRKALKAQVTASESRRPIEDFLIVVCLAAGLAVTVETGAIAPSELLVMGLLLLQTVLAIGRVQQYWQKALIYRSAYVSVETLIAETEAEREEHTGTEAPRYERRISLEGVVFGHDGERILDGLDLDIGAGEIVVITGPSGAGKTTVIDLILGLHRPDSGTVAIDGVPLERIDIAAWRAMVGYVSQELSLFHDTVRANVTLGDPTISDEGVVTALKTAGAWSFVERLPHGLDTEVGEKGTRLSGGQRQRIALARALVVEPRLLILDEVTSALDRQSEADLARRIAGLRGKLTVVAVTHRPALHAIADRVLHLEGGRLVEDSAARAVRAGTG